MMNETVDVIVLPWLDSSQPNHVSPETRGGGGGVLDISLSGEVRLGPSNHDPVEDKNCPIFDTLFKTFSPKLYPV